MRRRDRAAPQGNQPAREAANPDLTDPAEPIPTPDLVASRLHALARRDRTLLILMSAAFVFVAVLNIVALNRLADNTEQLKALAAENRRVLAVQVPTLRARIAERDRTILDLASEKEQAIAWVVHLATQLPDPPQIVICPPSRKTCQPTSPPPQRGASP